MIPQPAPVRPFVVTAESLRILWGHLDAMRPGLGDEFPRDPFAFVAWIDPDSVRIFEFGPPESPWGVGIFTGIDPPEGCWAHIFIWAERGAYPPADLVAAARVACASMFQAFGLARISGLTPVTNAPARVFAERVGFKIEGTLRNACSVNGMRTDAWISGMLPGDLDAPPPEAKPHDTLEVVEITG